MNNWIDLTDIVFHKAYDHMFIITKPQYRNDVITWSCTDKDSNVIAEGKTIKMAAAKSACKEIYKQLKQTHKSVRVKANGKLVYK